jgi:ElaB/YqjD/DUF883 family membrane-anchored ribosome-binding protein
VVIRERLSSACTTVVYMADEQDTHDRMTPPGTAAPGGQNGCNLAEVYTQMRETGEEVCHKAQELTAQGQEIAAACYQQSRAHVDAWGQQLAAQVRANPLMALFLAAGLGFLVGLLRRRWSAERLVLRWGADGRDPARVVRRNYGHTCRGRWQRPRRGWHRCGLSCAVCWSVPSLTPCARRVEELRQEEAHNACGHCPGRQCPAEAG